MSHIPAPPGVPAPPGAPGPPPRRLLRPLLAALLTAVCAVTVAGAAGTVRAVGSGYQPGSAVFVDQLRPASRAAALQQLLDRRAKAARGHDRDAFLADVDRADQAVVRDQEQEYENLTRLPLSVLEYELVDNVQYNALVPAATRNRYHAMVRAAAVNLRYGIQGVDTLPVAVPWVPIFAVVDGRWRIVGEAADRLLPTGANGQPWDGGPIAVARSARVVAVVSADDTARAGALLKMSEAALDRVAQVRPAGWSGRVLVTAVQDSRIFETYFANANDRVNGVAAIAVPYYEAVRSWRSSAGFVATRIVFNPNQLGVDDAELVHDLAHEFTHAAMGPVTAPATPTWLVEGFAEYVAYRGERVSSPWLRRALDGVPTGSLPTDTDFYSEPRNYVAAWLACRLIAERYGVARLLALYEAFQHETSVERAVPAVLGVDLATFTRDWAGYVEQARTGRQP